MEQVTKQEAILNKINVFFVKYAFNNRVKLEKLQLYIDVKDENELNFYLYADKDLIKSVQLKEILLTEVATEPFLNSDQVQEGIYQAIVNFSEELQVKKEDLQLLIKSRYEENEFFICINKHIDHKITINQIIL